MRRLKYHDKKLRWPHPSLGKCRNVTIAVVSLVVYFLSGCHAASPYANSGAESGTLVVPPSGNTCTDPKVIPMDQNNAQSGVVEGSYFVTNDTWNAHRYSGLSQTLYVCNYDSWYTTATMNNDTGDGAVKTSPNVQQTWYPTPTRISNWKSITSQFSDVPPGVGSKYGIWEFEYDIWLNGLADSNSTEIMIWTYNNGQTPSGSPVEPFTDGGRPYVVYHSSPPHQYVAFVGLNNDLSGNVNLLHFFDYVISKGWLQSSARLYQICHGVELVSTNGKPEKFAINNFSIKMQPYS